MYVFLLTYFLAVFLCPLIGYQGRIQLSTEGGQLLCLARGATQRLSLVPHEDMVQEPTIVQRALDKLQHVQAMWTHTLCGVIRSYLVR